MKKTSRATIEEALAVMMFTGMVMIPFWGKAYHIDEPFFLELARGLLHLPSGAASIQDFRSIPWPQLNNNPPFINYLLAGAYWLTGGGERLMRMAFFPFDLAAALGLYLLASRFLSKPLLPVLCVIASPAYLINMNHLMTEKLASAFGFFCLYALVRGIDEQDPAWYWASAVLLSLATVSKYLCIFLWPTAAFYAWSRKVPARRLIPYLVVAALPMSLYVLYDTLSRGLIFYAAKTVSEAAAAGLWSSPSHRIRSFLAFTGGCGAFALAWPFLNIRRPLWLASALTAAIVLFGPWLDLVPGVRFTDRILGIGFSTAAICAFMQIVSLKERGRGWSLWAAWTATAGFMALSYWTIAARVVFFVIPPLILASAEILERISDRESLGRIQVTTLCGTLALSFCLGIVDMQYAGAQRDLAKTIAEQDITRGKRVYCAARGGLRHYLLAAGAVDFDGRKDWDKVRPGDVIVSAKINAILPPPPKPILADVSKFQVDSPIPLRLTSAWGGEAGFYSNISGFLPYSLSQEPLEEFTLITAR